MNIQGNQAFFKRMKSSTYTDTPIQGGYSSEIVSLSVNNTGSTVVNTRTDKTIRIWRATPDKLVEAKTIPQAHEKAVERVSWHPKYENTFASVGRDSYVKIWRGNGSLSHEFEVKKDDGSSAVNQFADYSTDGELLVVVDRDSTLSFFSVGSGYKKVFESKIADHVYDFKWFNYEHKYFMLALHDGTIPVYEVRDGAGGEPGTEGIVLKTTLTGHRSSITSLFVDPKGHFFVAGSNEGVVSMFRTKDMIVERIIGDVDQAVSSVAVSRDGIYISVTYDDVEQSRIYDRESGTEIFSVPNSLSGKSVLPYVCWFPNKMAYVYTSGNCTTMTYMMRD